MGSAVYGKDGKCSVREDGEDEKKEVQENGRRWEKEATPSTMGEAASGGVKEILGAAFHQKRPGVQLHTAAALWDRWASEQEHAVYRASPKYKR